MNEEQQKIIKNFTTLEEDLIDSPFKENFSILRRSMEYRDFKTRVQLNV